MRSLRRDDLLFDMCIKHMEIINFNLKSRDVLIACACACEHKLKN